VADLAELLSVPAERDLPNGRRHLLKEHLMTELRNDQAGRQAAGRAGPGGPRRPWSRRTRLWWPGRAGVAAAAGAAALTAAVAAGSVWALGGGAAGPAGAGPAAHQSAARLLAKVAEAAAAAKPRDVTDSQFTYIDSQVSYGTNDGPAPEQTHRRQVWIPVADLCAGGLLIEDGVRYDMSSVVVPAYGTPVGGTAKGGTAKPKPKAKVPAGGTPITPKCPEPGGLSDPTYRLLQSLPTDPQALLDLIYKTKHGTDQEGVFTTIGDMLRESIAPPAVSAALYRAAALIPGVTVVPSVTDAMGRSGVAVSFTYFGRQDEWIFDPHTFQFLGERSLLHGTVVGKSAIVTRAIVDHAGELPAGG
jgi:hypothetical protein